MNNKYKRILSLIFILFVLSFIAGYSYSLYEKEIQSQKNLSFIDTNENLSVNYLDGKDFNVSNLESDASVIKKISITNVSSKQLYITLSLMDIEKSQDNISITLLDSDTNIVYSDKLTNMDCEILKTKEIEAGKTLSYSIVIKNTGKDVLNKFNANILAYTELNKVDVENFKATILKNNQYKNNSITQVGKEISSTDEGLIVSNDDDGETYYFRGNVLNNYVNFAGFSFRILRINGDGTVRLIMNNPIDDLEAYNNNSETVDDYSSKLIYQNTSLKSILNKWLDSNLSDYSKYLAQTSFCNETSVNADNGYLPAYNRLFVDNTPSLVCNGTIEKNSIGLITADEVEYAGAFQDKTNANYFLYIKDIKNAWWTMSGSQILSSNNSVAGIAVGNNGALSYDKKISTQLLIRPVISLDKNVTVSGLGSQDNPYIVKSN